MRDGDGDAVADAGDVDDDLLGLLAQEAAAEVRDHAGGRREPACRGRRSGRRRRRRCVAARQQGDGEGVGGVARLVLAEAEQARDHEGDLALLGAAEARDLGLDRGRGVGVDRAGRPAAPASRTTPRTWPSTSAVRVLAAWKTSSTARHVRAQAGDERGDAVVDEAQAFGKRAARAGGARRRISIRRWRRPSVSMAP